MSFKKLSFIWLLGACVGMVHAQDPQFSQFYANPLYLSPAFAGGDLAPRITLNYRNQWPGLAANYTTTSFGIDHYFANVNSGVGLLVVNDSQGTGNLRTTDIAAQYAYQLRITESTALRMGLQGSYSTRSADLSALTFPDQYTNRGFTGNPTLDPVALNGTPSIGYMSFATGLLLYADRYWVGVSAHHINRPEQGFFQVAEGTRLPLKGTLHAGLRIPIGGFTGLGDELDREKSISPAILYKFQGKFDQLDLGVYLTYSPIVLGLWYRGLPVKKYAPNISNRESIIGLVGYRQDRFSFGYSYDLTISALGLPSGGSHEISLAYTFEWEPVTRQRRVKKDKQLSCPKF